jgi:rhodanese-related sulfurtransferase
VILSSTNPGRWTVHDLKRAFDEGDPLVLVDVREPVEREFCRIPVPSHVDNRHIPLNTIPASLAELQQAASIALLVLYCHHGVRSDMAAQWLRHQGITGVVDLEGGIDAWSISIDREVPRYG